MKYPIVLFAALCAAACDDQLVTSNDVQAPLIQVTTPRPAGADPSACWDKAVSNATLETVNNRVLIKPAQISPDGRIQAPPVYRNETRQQVVTPRQENWFQTPCAADLTPEFVASLQRALQARDYYAGLVTGFLDPSTRRAVHLFQQKRGLDSATLSIDTARTLGLWAVERQPPDAADAEPETALGAAPEPVSRPQSL